MIVTLYDSQTKSQGFHLSLIGCALLACHGEDAHNPADAPFSQQGHFNPSGCAFLLLPPGLERGPDAGAKNQQVEKHHGYHTWDVDCHDGLVDWFPPEPISE